MKAKKKEVDPNAWLAAAVKAVDAKPPTPKPEDKYAPQEGPTIMLNWKRGR